MDTAPRARSTRDTRPPGQAPRLDLRRREAVAGYVFLLPWLVGIVGLTLGPMLASLWLSFTDYDLLSAPEWIGVENYVDLLADERYLKSITVTLVYVFLSVPSKLAFALLLAIMLNRGLRGLSIYRAVYYVPSLLGASVAVAVLWRQLFGETGVVNLFLRGLGWNTPPDWINDTRFALHTLVLLAVWEFGSPMIIFLAGLRQIPQEFYEAARVDGAGRLAQFFRITLPLLTPLVLFNLVLQMIGAFQAFTPSYIVSGGTGGPVDSTLFYTLYLYQQAFGLLHMGYGAAMAWVLLIAGAGLMLYPLVWMVSASFKPNAEIFREISLLPTSPTVANYVEGWTALGPPFTGFLLNSALLCVFCVAGNLCSCTLAAFAFARLRFPLRRVLFALMLVTIMLPFHVTIVPQYVLFQRLGWVGTFIPIVLPKFLAVDAFFVFLLVQFIRTLPRELDDSAKIDGCGPFRLFGLIVLPLTVPALATTAIFTFLWTWNDFFSQLLYLGGRVQAYTVPVALGAFVDGTSQSSWGQLLAMSFVSLLPILGFFVAFQKLLLEGISTTGIKG